jgi:hypothetical protein
VAVTPPTPTDFLASILTCVSEIPWWQCILIGGAGGIAVALTKHALRKSYAANPLGDDYAVLLLAEKLAEQDKPTLAIYKKASEGKPVTKGKTVLVHGKKVQITADLLAKAGQVAHERQAQGHSGRA